MRLLQSQLWNIRRNYQSRRTPLGNSAGRRQPIRGVVGRGRHQALRRHAAAVLQAHWVAHPCSIRLQPNTVVTARHFVSVERAGCRYWNWTGADRQTEPKRAQPECLEATRRRRSRRALHKVGSPETVLRSVERHPCPQPKPSLSAWSGRQASPECRQPSSGMAGWIATSAAAYEVCSRLFRSIRTPFSRLPH